MVLLTADDQFYDAETHYIAAGSLSPASAPAFARMMLRWNAVYAEKLALSEPKQPPKESVERVLSGAFVLRGWIPYVCALTQSAAHALARERDQVLGHVCEGRGGAPCDAAAAGEAEPSRPQVAGQDVDVYGQDLRHGKPRPELCAEQPRAHLRRPDAGPRFRRHEGGVADVCAPVYPGGRSVAVRLGDGGTWLS